MKLAITVRVDKANETLGNKTDDNDNNDTGIKTCKEVKAEISKVATLIEYIKTDTIVDKLENVLDTFELEILEYGI